jgi:3-oxoacyl-[acyl-carrier protein] reductase
MASVVPPLRASDTPNQTSAASASLSLPDPTIGEPLAGRTALITGGSRGIGRAAAEGLARAGATVVLVGRGEVRAQEVAAQFVDAGLDALGIGCDVADPDAVMALPGRLGPLAQIDILVLSAGVMSGPTTKTLRTEPSDWHQILDINLNGAWHVIRAFGPDMAARRSGRIIAVSACLGRFTGPGTNGGLAPYRVSKAALNAMVKNLAAETGSGTRGVLVDAMCPNHCRTDMGGPNAPRSAHEGADTIVWLATRAAQDAQTGFLWEDRSIIPW